MLKINELLRTELAQLIRDEMPAEFKMIVVYEIETTSDLKEAKVWLGRVDRKLQVSDLNAIVAKNHLFIRKLQQKLNLKYIPKFHFYQDKSCESIHKIEKLLEKVEKENED